MSCPSPSNPICANRYRNAFRVNPSSRLRAARIVRTYRDDIDLVGLIRSPLPRVRTFPVDRANTKYVDSLTLSNYQHNIYLTSGFYLSD